MQKAFLSKTENKLRNQEIYTFTRIPGGGAYDRIHLTYSDSQHITKYTVYQGLNPAYNAGASLISSPDYRYTF